MSKFFRRAVRTAAAGAVLSQAAVAEDAFELVSAQVDGRDVLVFVDGQGTAVAVELEEAKAEVLTGLAAGALLSDVEGAPNAFRLDQATRSGTNALIDGMARLSEAQKSELKSALAL